MLTNNPLSSSRPSDLASQECSSRGSVGAVCQMGRSDDKSATAHKIAGSAEDLSLSSRVPGNASAILQVAGEAEQDNALNLRHHRGIEPLDGVIHHGGALAVASGDNLGVWALGVGKVEEGGGGADGRWRRVLGQKVVGEGGFVWGADALAGHLGGAEEGLEGSADLRANDGALIVVNIHLFLGFSRGGRRGMGGDKRKRGTNHVSRLGGAACKDEGHILAGAVLELVGGGRLAGHDGWEGISIDGFVSRRVGSCYCDGGKGRDDEGLELHICGRA